MSTGTPSLFRCGGFFRFLPLLALIGLVVAQPGSAFAGDKEKFEVGEKVPVFTLKALNPEASGETWVSIDKYFQSSDQNPKKAILMSFFATYCEPCKKEMPYLAALYDTYKDQGLQVLLVSIDKDKENLDIAQKLAAENGVKFPVLADRFNIVARRYFIEKLPCVYILDGNGTVTEVHVGYSEGVGQSFLNAVRKNLGLPTSEPVPPALASYIKAPAAAAQAPAETPAADSDAAEDTKAVEEAPPAKGKKKKRRKKRRKKRKK